MVGMVGEGRGVDCPNQHAFCPAQFGAARRQWRNAEMHFALSGRCPFSECQIEIHDIIIEKKIGSRAAEQERGRDELEECAPRTVQSTLQSAVEALLLLTICQLPHR